MTESNCDKILAKIHEIENRWKEDLKKQYGGGLDSKTNEQLIKLRILYNQVCKENKKLVG